jgi:hypothetical protein
MRHDDANPNGVLTRQGMTSQREDLGLPVVADIFHPGATFLATLEVGDESD